MFRRRQRSGPSEDVRRVWAVCSAVLDYPTCDLVAAVDGLEALASGFHLAGVEYGA